MPIYAYKCLGCGHTFDKIQRMSDAPLTDCPQCEEALLKKQVTAAAFKLTGTGWYETDFKNNTDKNKSADTSKSDTGSTVKSDSESKSSDSKSSSKDSKSETKTKSKKDAA